MAPWPVEQPDPERLQQRTVRVLVAAYLGSARRRPRRFKVRTRSYLDSELCVLEVKTRDARQRTVKHRVPYDFDDRYHLSAGGRAFVGGIEQAAAVVDELDPALITTYQRTTLALAGGSSRVTIDTDIAGADVDGQQSRLTAWVLVETKTTGQPAPSTGRFGDTVNARP